MQGLTLLIAVAALVVAIAAFARTGGIKVLSREAKEAKALAARATADALEKIEERLRGAETDGPRRPENRGVGAGSAGPSKPEQSR